MAEPNDGQVITEAWEAYVNQDPTDNVFTRHALLEELRKNGLFEKQNGRAIFHILEYAQNSTVKWMSEYEELAVEAQTTFDQAEYAWKLVGGDVPISEFEKAITAAGAGKFDLLAKKIDNLKSTIEETINTACFSVPNVALAANPQARWQLGNAPRVDPDLRGHYMHNWNFAVTKTTPIQGRVNLTLRAEAFNLFNRSQFGMPNTQVTTAAQSNLGRVTTQSNQPRLIQLAFRLTF